jgi:RNA polymerase sigma-70 factor (ECF subfamily)
MSRRTNTARREEEARENRLTLELQEATEAVRREQACIERAQAGEVAAFRELYDLHFSYVVRHVRRLLGPGADCDDVVQEVFVQVYKSLGNYRGESRFSTWLYRVTRNVAISHLRSRPHTVELQDWRHLRSSRSEWDRLEARDMLRALYAALDNVSIEHREAFLLHEVDGLKLREIAEMTDDSINTVAARIRRTREKLRTVLEQSGGEA